MKPEGTQIEQELATILAQIPQETGLKGLSKNAQWQERLRIAATRTRSAPVLALIKQQLLSAEREKEFLAAEEILARPPTLSLPPEVPATPALDPRITRGVDLLLEQIPARTGENIGQWEDEVRRLREIQRQTASSELLAEIERRLEDLKPFHPPTAQGAVVGAFLLIGICTAAGTVMFAAGIGLIYLFKWLEVVSAKGIVLVAILLIGGPVIAILGAFGAVSSLLSQRMYLAAFGAITVLAGILYAGWLVYQQF